MRPFAFRALARPALSLTLAMLLASCARSPRVDQVSEFKGLIATLPAEWEAEPVIVLADSVSIRFMPGKDGNRVQHRRATWYYVNRRNPNVLEQAVIADYQSIEVRPNIRSAAFYPGGGGWTSGPHDLSRVRYAEAELHSSDRFLTSWRFPRYVEGMLIRTEVTRNYLRPEFLKSELMREELPALSKTVSLALPPGSDIRHAFLNPEGLQVDTSRVQGPEGQVLTVTATRLPKLEPRSMPRDPETWYAALHFSLPARGPRSLTWAETGDRYLEAIAAAFASSPDLDDLAAGLPRVGPDSLIRRVYGLLRSRIRYHADLGILHTFVPRKAGEVLAKGYGDCKEMSTLMTQILRGRGVKAGVALVSTPGTLQVVEGFPSLGGFNHMIVWAEGPDGSLRFFDPTVKHGDPEDSYYHLIDRTALVLRPGASGLRAVPMAPGFRNRVETRSVIRRAADGNGWTLAGTIRLEGHCAFSLLPGVNAAPGEEKGPLLKAWLKELFAVDAREARLVSATGRSLEVGYEASFDSHYLAMDKGGLLMAWPSLYGGDVRFTSVEAEGPRHLRKFEQSDRWEIPSGFVDLEKIDLDHGFARGRWTRQGGAVERSYSAEPAVVPADRRGDLTEYIARRNRFVRATLWKR